MRRRILYTLLGMLAVLTAASLWWRWASRRHQLPCPTWLAWWLNSSLADILAATTATLDHIGLQPGERGLDVGSGPGRLSLPAARRVGPTGTIVAFDIQPHMLTRLQKNAARTGITNITTRLGDITTDQSLPAERFDRAWLVTVLGEIPDRSAALQNIYRVLKAGGTLSITEILGDPHYQKRETVLRLGRAAGFEATQSWRTGLAFTQNFVKPETRE
jgi:ubiquinone/menaquinone biosynthesis C-methylase UbiE